MSESVTENTITGFYSIFSTTLKVLCPQRAHDFLNPTFPMLPSQFLDEVFFFLLPPAPSMIQGRCLTKSELIKNKRLFRKGNSINIYRAIGL